MSETVYDGPPSPADNERALVEVAAERDQLRQQVELLLERADAHRAERSHGRTANLDWADKQLDEAADQVRKELEG
jgi:hypothetical protein